MIEILKKLSLGEKVIVPTDTFKEIRNELNSANIEFKISACVGKLQTVLNKI